MYPRREKRSRLPIALIGIVATASEREVQVLTKFELPRRARVRRSSGLGLGSPFFEEIRQLCSGRAWIDDVPPDQEARTLTFRIHTPIPSALTFDAFESWLKRLFSVVSGVADLLRSHGLDYD